MMEGGHKAAFFLSARLFPEICAVCGCEGSWLCVECGCKIPLAEHGRCHFCRRPASLGVCDDCRIHGLDALCPCYDYSYRPLAGMIHDFKYKFARSLARPLGNLLIAGWQLQLQQALGLPSAPRWARGFDLIVPVPLAQARFNWRGFNQAQELAQLLSVDLGCSLEAAGLERIKNTKAQARLKAQERQRNLEAAFRWQGGDLQGQKILLVDDVLTTGATMAQAAQELKRSGAAIVVGLALAKDK